MRALLASVWLVAVTSLLVAGKKRLPQDDADATNTNTNNKDDLFFADTLWFRGGGSVSLQAPISVYFMFTPSAPRPLQQIRTREQFLHHVQLYADRPAKMPDQFLALAPHGLPAEEMQRGEFQVDVIPTEGIAYSQLLSEEERVKIQWFLARFQNRVQSKMDAIQKAHLPSTSGGHRPQQLDEIPEDGEEDQQEEDQPEEDQDASTDDSPLWKDISEQDALRFRQLYANFRPAAIIRLRVHLTNNLVRYFRRHFRLLLKVRNGPKLPSPFFPLKRTPSRGSMLADLMEKLEHSSQQTKSLSNVGAQLWNHYRKLDQFARTGDPQILQ